MEELALKPDAAIPTNINYAQLEQNSVVRNVLTYNYGEDVSKWAVVLPFTLNHTQTNNLLALFDGQGDTYYMLSTSSSQSNTTNIILDFGKVLEIRGVIVSFLLEVINGGGGQSFETAYSLDMVNWTRITLTQNSGYFDHVAALSRIRGLRLSYGTANNEGSLRDIKIFQSLVIV